MASKPRPIGRGRSRGAPSAAKKEDIPTQGAPPIGVPERRPGAVAEEQPPRMQKSIGRGTADAPAVASPSVLTEGISQMQIATGRGGGGDAMSRGALRGRRVINPELLLTRPTNVTSKQGTLGRPLKLQANYFKLLTSTNWCLHKYDVAFDQQEDRTVVRKGLLKPHKEILGGYIFDGTTLYTSNRLPQPLEVYSKRVSDDAKIKITIRLVGEMVKGDECYLQFFNIIMRKCLEYLNLQLVGRNFYDAQSKIEVPKYKLELWPGYETSIRQHEQGILMCTEIRHKVMRHQTLLDLLTECYNRHGAQYQKQFNAMVIGITVLTEYNNNTYRVDDVAYDYNPKSTFKRKGEDISYLDYYQQRYDIKIRHQTQPLLVSKMKSRDRRAGLPEMVYLLPELCKPTGMNDDMRKDTMMMRELAQYTRLNPKERVDRLLNFNTRLQRQKNVADELKLWNMQLDQTLVTLPARRLEPQNIVFGRNARASAGDNASWDNSVRDFEMLCMKPLKNWVLLFPNAYTRDAQEFVKTMRKSVTKMKFEFADPIPYYIKDDRANSYTIAIEDIMSRTNPQLIMCIVQNNRADRYSAIKKKCCIDRPVPTQCLLAKTLGHRNVMSIATKIAIQINCKIGGAAWSVEVPASGLMVVGFDVCHDTSGKGCDYGALVASLDKAFSRYFSAVSAHQNGEELSNDLAVNMCKAVQKYREVNGELPTRIVVYRDGVGEGQIPYVFEHEVENLRRKLSAVYGNPDNLRMAYIIVTKRLMTRLFFNGNNPPSGTVVDDVITNPNKYDFFIVSQAIRNGSVSPTGYSVISDNVALAPSNIQSLTYKLTHLYFNWSGTVRVPAPCQFAHKLAFLVSQFIHGTPSNHLETLLYFL